MYEDQMIRFNVYLQKNQDASLKMNKSVVVKVFSSKRENVLRIKKQDSIENTTEQTVYLVNGKEGRKTTVILGVIGNEWSEVVSGLKEGDVIIATDKNLTDSPQTIEVK